MNYRFDEHSIKMSKVLKLMPPDVFTRDNYLTDKDLEDFLSVYEDDLPNRSTVNTELHCWCLKWKGDKETSEECNTVMKALKEADSDFFPNIRTILKIAATHPVTSCECERSISKLRLVKSLLRTAMLQERLNGLAMLYVHADMPLDNADIIDRFAKCRPRRMKLTNILESGSD